MLDKQLNIHILIFSVLIFSNQADLDAQLEKLRAYLNERMPARVALKVFERIMIYIADYSLDEVLYLKDRMRVFEFLVQNIQLYRLVLDMWNEPRYQDQSDILKIAVQNAYDKRYHLDAQSQHALAYQMRQCASLSTLKFRNY
ncbi:hypothetical protein [Helicobacter baculiformis]|uniref:hypothetical protein n=1 Tax=Helicobacter baculiformis TaxID=427351 RepID=UPI0036D260B5